jgi:hypothetical protein
MTLSIVRYDYIEEDDNTDKCHVYELMSTYNRGTENYYSIEDIEGKNVEVISESIHNKFIKYHNITLDIKEIEDKVRNCLNPKKKSLLDKIIESV